MPAVVDRKMSTLHQYGTVHKVRLRRCDSLWQEIKIMWRHIWKIFILHMTPEIESDV